MKRDIKISNKSFKIIKNENNSHVYLDSESANDEYRQRKVDLTEDEKRHVDPNSENAFSLSIYTG